MGVIHLYIGNIEVEFDTIPEILYTYQVDDLTNPTVVKNSFSKTITIRGTKSNNHLFGHYWNVERAQVGGSANAASVYFNASKKMAFSLYVDTELYEEGYVKLDEVRRVNGNYEYDITLFGGLGDFFYNLSLNDDGNEMKLSDLEFEDDIDFTINLDTVKSAWSALKNDKAGKWQTINFMPAYNGKPDNFDADKMLIDTSKTSLAKSKGQDGKTYKTKEGWVMAELPDEMTEWETRDLRSYLQRPCIRMKEVIKACCDPVNNGGYEVDLDTDFFNENNPYWEKTWMTLPMIQALEYDSGEQALKGAKLIAGTTEGDAEGYMYQPLTFDMGEFPTSVVSRISLTAGINPSIGYNKTSYVWFWNWNGDSYHTGWWCVGSLFCQLLAFNGDTVVGASDVYNLTTPIRHNGKLYYGDTTDYSGGHNYTPYMSKQIYNVLGEFKSGGFTKENASSPATFTFTISGLTTNITGLKMCYYWGASKDKIKKFDKAFCCFDKTYCDGWMTYDISSQSSSKASDCKMELKSTTLKAVMGGTIGRTGTEVSKQLILNTEASPADYLLSYCKMFGLYFSKSLYENKIYIQTRKSFYDRSKVTDISDLIDYSKGVTLKPIAFDAKWVEFCQESDETDFSTDYNTTKGVSYGSKILNTGYEFDSERKKLLEGNVIKSGIEGLERSKYFTCYNNDNKVRPFFGYGMKYNLYNGDDTIDVNGTNSIGSNLLGINEGDGMKYYDVFPKMQFHKSDNDPSDGNNVLVFFSGFKNLTTGRANPINYFLTDDSYWQSQLNDGTPCWLFVSEDKDVNEKPIARKMAELPVFERYLTDTNGTTVKKSLDFGTAQELYIPKYSIKEDVNIYSNFWKTYLEDLYDINTKVLTVYIRLKSKVGYDLLRQFYWFENAVWRINKISDWNIGLEDVTKVEFVKVQDLTGYTSVTQTRSNVLRLAASKYKVAANGEMVMLSLTTDNGGDWRLTSNDNSLAFSKVQGSGNNEVTLTIPQTKTPTSNATYSITAIDDEGNTTTINIVQGYDNETKLTLSPTKLIVPHNGGTYDIDFKWVNQGDNDVDAYNFVGDVTGNVTMNGFEAEVSVNESNEKDTIISGKVLFNAGNYDGEVLIDQMPSVLEFGKDGGEYTLSFNYNTEVSYEYLPYWATVEGNTLTVIPNYYESERSANIMVQNSNSFAYIRLVQEVGNSPAPETPKVSPNSLYFDVEGGTQFLSINILNTWVITESLDWITTNLRNGDSNGIVQVVATANDGDSRSGYITIQDIVTKENINVYVGQVGSSSTKSFSINPTSISAPKNGGSYKVEITYANRNGDYVGIDTALKHTDLLWNGDRATLTVEVPSNTTIGYAEHSVVFTTAIGNYTLPISVYPSEERVSVSKSTITIDYNSGSDYVNMTSNVEWTATASNSWITVTPTSGDNDDYQLYITYTKNMSIEPRTGYVWIDSKANGERLATIVINQGALIEEIVASPSTIVFEAEGGTATLTITSNTIWEIEGL